MPKGGQRHRLTFYTFMLDRWWKLILFIGIVLVVLAAGLAILPVLLPGSGFLLAPDWKLWLIAGAGGFTLLMSAFLIAIRKKAYVQPFGDHLRLVTPFLRLNISYRRIRRATSAEMQQLFPPNRLNHWQKEMLRPLAKKTAVVLEMTGLPISRAMLKFYLSPFFFPDKTASLVLLVPDWIKFSNELESRRGNFQDGKRPQTDALPQSRILSEISRYK